MRYSPRIDEQLEVARSKERVANEIRAVMRAGAPRIVFQPIYQLAGDTLSSGATSTPIRTGAPWRRGSSRSHTKSAARYRRGGRRSELDLLRRIGADEVQGHLLGRPLPLADALALAQSPRSEPRRAAG